MRTLGYEDAEKFHRQINSRPARRRARCGGNLDPWVASLERGQAGIVRADLSQLRPGGAHLCALRARTG